jgi:hypothetical protein
MLTLLALVAPHHLYGQTPSPDYDHQLHDHGFTEAPTPQTPEPQAGMTGMMTQMKAAGLRLDGLVKKMNAATGAAKTEAMAELLTALVEQHRMACEGMMADKAPMMNMMGGRGGRVEGAPVAPPK